MNENNFGDFLNELGVDTVKIQLDESVNLAGKVVEAAADLRTRAIGKGFSSDMAEEMSLAFFQKILFG